MKKNVFSRAIAVLASMTVLGAASMMSASAAGQGIMIEGKEVPFGTTEATVSLSLTGDFAGAPKGAVITVTYPAELTAVPDDQDAFLKGSLVEDASAGTVAATFVNAKGMKTNFSSMTFTLPETDGTEDVTYPIDITITSLDDGTDTQTYVADPVATGGYIKVLAAEVEETTAAPTEAETEAEVTAAATEAATTVVTTAKPASTGSPKTGSAGVAVAVAGLVTAGATAVVLKKKH